MSGQNSGSSQVPITTNGSWKASTAPPASRLAVPLRSKSRDAIEEEPATPTRIAGVSIRTSWAWAVPSVTFRFTESSS